MLRITVTHEGSRRRITLEGRLVGPWVEQLRVAWRHERESGEPDAMLLDLCELASVDSAGKELLQELHAQGAELTATSRRMRPVLEEITSLAPDGCGTKMP